MACGHLVSELRHLLLLHLDVIVEELSLLLIAGHYVFIHFHLARVDLELLFYLRDLLRKRLDFLLERRGACIKCLKFEDGL